MTIFAAIDFETANHSPDSACALGVVLVEDGRIVLNEQYRICPPSPQFSFTHIHGIAWHDVCDAPSFGDLWGGIAPRLRQVDFLAAHNAPFDRRVLEACCRSHGVQGVPRPFVCTVVVARAVWGLRPTRLPDVCRHLNISLRHHDAGSDAEACARIVIAAQQAGWAR